MPVFLKLKAELLFFAAAVGLSAMLVLMTV